MICFLSQGHGVKVTSTSASQTHAKITGGVSTLLIDTAACVLMASPGSTARPTLMNARQCPVFTGGTDSSPPLKAENTANYAELFLITLLASAVSGDICHML